MGAVTAQNSKKFVEYTNCHECIDAGGRQCLLKDHWTYAVCCHPLEAYSSDFCMFE